MGIENAYEHYAFLHKRGKDSESVGAALNLEAAIRDFVKTRLHVEGATAMMALGNEIYAHTDRPSVVLGLRPAIIALQESMLFLEKGGSK